MYPVPEFSDVDAIFPTDTCLPPWETLDEEYQRNSHPCCKIASTLFFNGGRLEDFGLTPKAGVDKGKAIRALGVCLGSFEPKHEHKIAGVGFLLNEWFDREED